MITHTRPRIAVVAALLVALPVALPTWAADYGTLYRQTIEAWQAGEFDQALSFQMEAQRLRPDYPGILENIAAIQVRRDDHDAAIASLQRLAALGYQPNLPMNLYEPLAEHAGWPALIESFERNGVASGYARTEVELSLGGWVPEGIAYDAALEKIYLGSIRHGEILSIGPDGAVETLIDRDGGLWSVFGMEVDPRSNMLWVATSYMEQYTGPTAPEPGAAAIVSVDPYSGAIVSRFRIPTDEAAVLGDLTLGDDGTVYTTDSLGGVHALVPRTGAWRTLLPAGVMTSPQGLALHPDGSALYVADYRGGITRIPLDGGEPAPLELPADAGIYGIDGMECWNGHLVVVINGSNPHRILDLHLEPGGTRVDEVRSLLRADPRFDEPTLTAIRGGELLVVADSHWNRFDADGGLPPDEELSGPTVLAVPIDH
jgi:sugar lactone lactonase YvrE